MYQDQTLTCKEENCQTPGKQFVWTASEQEFYAAKGFSAPQRCPACRAAKKAEKQGGRFDRGPRQMHEITCANCGAKGEVPFVPRDPSNVLCADCFRNKRDAERGGMSHTPAPVASPVADEAPANDMGDDMTSADDTTTDSKSAE